MLVVKLEIWPFGDEESKRLIGELRISNVGGTKDEGDYKVKAINPAPHDGGTGFIEVGEIKKFPRLKKHVWDLVVLAINKLRSTPYPGGE